MTSPDRLALASDPQATPTWLATTLASAIDGRVSGPRASPDTSQDALIRRLVRNPALPFEVLGPILRGPPTFYSADAWVNPSVPLLLMGEPLPGDRDAAALVLVDLERQASPHRVGDGSRRWQGAPLERVVGFWARMQPGPELAIVRSFAGHLARLFGLPWPEARTAGARRAAG